MKKLQKETLPSVPAPASACSGIIGAWNPAKLSEYGNATLYLGDCMDLMAQYPDKHFDLAIVDPPWGGCHKICNFRDGGKWKNKFGGKIGELSM